MKHPVLFLDIDGVLATADTYRAFRTSGREGPYTLGHLLDRDCVKRLVRVLWDTGALVCISSSWRMDGLEKVKQALELAGLPPNRIVAATPVLRDGERGDEIAAALEDNPHWRPFAIVDDEEDMADLHHRLVRTDFVNGLTDVHVERLVQMLTEEA